MLVNSKIEKNENLKFGSLINEDENIYNIVQMDTETKEISIYDVIFTKDTEETKKWKIKILQKNEKIKFEDNLGLDIDLNQLGFFKTEVKPASMDNAEFEIFFKDKKESILELLVVSKRYDSEIINFKKIDLTTQFPIKFT